MIPPNACRPGEQLVQQTTKCPDVGALVDRQPARLFRTHVGGRSEDDAGLGCHGRAGGLRRGGVEALRDTEVQDLDVSFLGQRDVARLQVAVNDPLFVRRVESVRDLPGDRQRAGQGQGRVRIAPRSPARASVLPRAP